MINIESSPISSTNCTVFNITDDQLALEGSETFAVGISLPPGSPAVLGTLSQASVTIEDDDGKLYSLCTNSCRLETGWLKYQVALCLGGFRLLANNVAIVLESYVADAYAISP